MKIFHCDHCGQLVFFENTECVKCGSVLAYSPERREMIALQDLGEGKWGDERPTAKGTAHPNEHRRCENDVNEHVCNWAVDEDSVEPFCTSCRLTRVIPDLSDPKNRERWARVESAKRRMIDTLIALGLPLENKTDDPEGGLAFEFLADPADPSAPRVLTGHDQGLITLNIAEADDAEREKRRLAMNEAYRTLLGHFRHEVGHYYWDRIVRDTEWIDGFRKLFGDERNDYGEALAEYHKSGPKPGWESSYVSEYSTAHPWEDWAETWAHYLHLTDTLETAVESGLTLRPKRAGEPSLKPDVEVTPSTGTASSFDDLIKRWFPLTYVLNNLNRSMGQPDAYPFVLSTPAVEKLRFVHDVVAASKHAPVREPA